MAGGTIPIRPGVGLLGLAARSSTEELFRLGVDGIIERIPIQRHAGNKIVSNALHVRVDVGTGGLRRLQFA